jgi:flagellar hook-associated protein 3 FlgL
VRVTQGMLVETIRANISHNAQNLNKLQDQLSSGKRLRRASDDPASLTRALTLRTARARNEQYLRNIEVGRSWLEATDSALDHLTGILTRARDIAVRAASDTLGEDERKQLAAQVESLLQEAQAVGNTKQEGKYIFAGRQLSNAPFDITQDPIYRGDYNALHREVDADVTMQINTLDNELMINVTDSSGVTTQKGVIEASLTVLKAMESTLTAGQAVTATQTNELTECVHGVLELRGSVGARMSRLDATANVLEDNQLTNKATLSRVEDADAAEVMTKLMMQETVYQAALMAGARIIQPSLLDFLR